MEVMKRVSLVLVVLTGFLFVPPVYAEDTLSSEMKDALSKEPRDSNTLIEKGKVFLDPKDSKPYSGRVFIHVLMSGKRIVDQRGLLIRGKAEGRWRAFYEGEKSMWESHFKRGKRHGQHREWRKDGSKNFEVFYENDLMHGRFTSWAAEGKPLYRTLFEKGSGRAIYFYPHGTKSLEIPYVAGKTHGVQKSWSVDGFLYTEANHLDGKRSGRTTTVGGDGHRTETYFRNDMKHGLMTRWNAKGRKIHEVHYEKGEQHGDDIQWGSDGLKQRSAQYQHGKQHGIERYIGVREDGAFGLWTCQWKQGVKGKCHFRQGETSLP